MQNIPQLIPVRMLTQFVYCKRLAYMEWVQGEFEYNSDVVDGKYQHRNVDVPSGSKQLEKGVETIHARSVEASDAGLGIITKADILEIDGNVATPVEYKRGKVPTTPEQAYKDHMVQLCAQGLILRANGYECDRGIVYYIGSKQRIEIEFDDDLINDTFDAINEMKEMAKNGRIPPPLVDSPKCPRCSLVGICLPDEVNMLSTTKTADSDVRRMYPIRNDAKPLYVQEQGAKVSLSGETLKVTTPSGNTTTIKFIDLSEITVFGNVQITTQAIRKMCERNISICYLTYGGKFVGMVSGASHKNIELRMAQHKKHYEEKKTLAISRQIVFGKIKNCITLVRRNHKKPPTSILKDMEMLAERTKTVKKYDVLLGIEGMAARQYFAIFNELIKTDSAEFIFTERNRRPPRDPVNAILSFLYMMLLRQAVITTSIVGLDPHLGFLHMPKYGKPALALDIMEEFRPLVADSTCLTLINQSMIGETDLQRTPFGTNLTSDGRRKVIQTYESRMDTTVRHNILGYSASYRRIMETQVRLLARCLTDEVPQYLPFRTR